MATHSAEFIAESEPSDIILVDKKKKSGKRLIDIDAVQEVLNIIGSIQNITLTQLARSRKILFIEGQDDYYILRRFAKKIALPTISYGGNITPVESGGFSYWEKIKSLAWGFEKSLGKTIRMAVVFDRDYWCEEQIKEIYDEMNKSVTFAYIFERKEIENYMLIHDALERCIYKLIKNREEAEEFLKEKKLCKILDNITSLQKEIIQGQYIAKRVEYLKNTKKDSATIIQETIKWFEKKWKDINTRMEIIPGKHILQNIRSRIQDMYKITLTDARIIDEIKKEEIPKDLILLLNDLEKYSLS